MQHINRRTVLAGVGTSILGSSLPARSTWASSELETEGCCLRAEQESIVAKDLTGALGTSSGNPDLDRYLGKALVRLSTVFGVYPGFIYFTDRFPNARAFNATLLPGTRGTVLFGLNLLRKCLAQYNDQGLTVLSVCAHEFGHIVQYNTQYYAELKRGQRNDKLLELHADYLSGFYLGNRKREHSNLSMQDVGRYYETLGDTAYTHPKHHGTSDERITAIEAGFFLGKFGVTSIIQAAATGAEFVRRFS